MSNIFSLLISIFLDCVYVTAKIKYGLYFNNKFNDKSESGMLNCFKSNLNKVVSFKF